MEAVNLFGVSSFVDSDPVYIVDVEGKNTKTNTAQGEVAKDVMMVVDVSGSMTGSQDNLVQTIVEVGKSLGPQDNISVTLFSTTARVIYTLQGITNIAALEEKCKKEIVPRGGTTIYQGLKLALEDFCAKTVNNITNKEENADKNENNNNKTENNNNNNSNNAQERIALVMLLSDGQDTSITVDGLVSSLQDIIRGFSFPCKLTFHSFGFTDSHDFQMLQAVTLAGNAGSGLYYSFSKKGDIAPAIGDCLGVVSKVCATNLSLRAYEVEGDKETPVPFYWGTSGNADTDTDGKIGTLASGQHQSFVVKHGSGANPLRVRLEYMDVTKGTFVVTSIIIPAPKAKVASATDTEVVGWQQVHAETHMLRLRIGVALQRLIDPAGLNLIPELEVLHETLLSKIEQVKLLEENISLADEGVLVSLEQDLGEALVRVKQSAGGVLQPSLRSRFLQFGHEHIQQRSASTASNARGTYATKEQLSMRLRFLAASDPKMKNRNDVIATKQGIPIEEDGLTTEQIEMRRQVDQDLTCFVSLENWREAELGIGLLVKPRTLRERYKDLMPVAELVSDYISASGYNSGVKATVAANAALDRENLDTEEEHQMVKSSARGRINAWLPLYINEWHWESAKIYAPAAFSIIATQYNDMFEPIHVLKVCSKLMIANVVKFTIQDQNVSERAIQMYCDIHRLFLQMLKEYPTVAEIAVEKLTSFISTPEFRKRSITPDLGELIEYLTVTTKYSWDDLKKPYIMESFRRNARFIKDTIGHVRIQSLNDVDELLDLWMRGTSGGRVTMFNVLFMNVIARPKDMPIEEIMDMYDSRWGKVPADKLVLLKNGYEEIMKVTSLQEVLSRLGVPMEKEAIGELILWAFEHKEETGKVPKNAALPSSGGPLLAAWKESCALYKKMLENPQETPMPIVIPAKHSPPKPYHVEGVAEFLKRRPLDSPSEHQEHVQQVCECTRCKRLKVPSTAIQEWKERRKEAKQDPETQLFIGGIPKTFEVPDIVKLITEQIEFRCKISDCTVDVVKDQKDKLKGYGFITTKDKVERDKILDSHKKRNFLIGTTHLMIDEVRGGKDPKFLPRYLGGTLGKQDKFIGWDEVGSIDETPIEIKKRLISAKRIKEKTVGRTRPSDYAVDFGGLSYDDYEEEEEEELENIPAINWTSSAGDEPLLDLVFCVDCTASMGSYIKQAQAKINHIITKIIASEQADVRFALVMYRDYPPQDTTFPTIVFPFTSSLEEMQANVDQMSAHGGGDAPECVATGLEECSLLPYREKATKVCVLVADAPPHGLEPGGGDGFPDGDPGDHDLLRISRTMHEKGIKVFVVDIFCPEFTVAWMRWMAELTGGKYIQLKQANHLAPVIIAGCREELQLKKLQNEVALELEILRNEKKIGEKIHEDMDELSNKIAERLNVRGIALLRIDVEVEITEHIQAVMAIIESSFSLPEAKKRLISVFGTSKRAISTPSKSKKSIQSVQAPITPAQVQKALENLRVLDTNKN
eukprot:Phypoly_transcript_00526.p1 GENE.Phypoly_transcript_00526~~Phypoly_transcript_00526.p1  ORF type:complete len:1493 (+),score=259.06 Phypoly_transcript_00526:63-4541(+)